MSNPDSTTTININVVSEGSNKPQNNDQVINCPLPWPNPWPHPYQHRPYYPFPTGSGGPYDPFQKPSGSDIETDAEYLIFYGVKMAMNIKINDEFDAAEMREHLEEEVLPRIMKSQSIKEINSAMEKVYVAYPNIKEFVQSTTEQYGGSGTDEGIQKKGKLPFWLKLIIKIVIMILKAILEKK